jgi:predicted nucleic acid-binding protein
LNFLDSNILVYTVDRAASPAKRGVAQRIVSGARRDGAVISFQVVQETLNVVTHKWASPLSPADTEVLLAGVLLPLWKVQPTEALYRRGLDIRVRYGYSFYDSMIIASALTGGCDRLLTEDLQSGQMIEGLTMVNPFLEPPPA